MDDSRRASRSLDSTLIAAARLDHDSHHLEFFGRAASKSLARFSQDGDPAHLLKACHSISAMYRASIHAMTASMLPALDAAATGGRAAAGQASLEESVARGVSGPSLIGPQRRQAPPPEQVGPLPPMRNPVPSSAIPVKPPHSLQPKAAPDPTSLGTPERAGLAAAENSTEIQRMAQEFARLAAASVQQEVRTLHPTCRQVSEAVRQAHDRAQKTVRQTAAAQASSGPRLGGQAVQHAGLAAGAGGGGRSGFWHAGASR